MFSLVGIFRTSSQGGGLSFSSPEERAPQKFCFRSPQMKRLIDTPAERSSGQLDMQDYFQEQGISELWIPREVVYIKNPPLLGSGKFDYQTAAELIMKQNS